MTATAMSVGELNLLVLLYFQDVQEKLIFPFRFEYSYETDEYKCYSKHFSDEIVEDEFAYFIVENYERTFRKVKRST